jgi:hypothetical protein
MHDAARTIILQSHAAAPHGAGGVSYQTWLVTMLLPMWIGVRVMSRTWAAALLLGNRHNRSGQTANDVVE